MFDSKLCFTWMLGSCYLFFVSSDFLLFVLHLISAHPSFDQIWSWTYCHILKRSDYSQISWLNNYGFIAFFGVKKIFSLKSSVITSVVGSSLFKFFWLVWQKSASNSSALCRNSGSGGNCFHSSRLISMHHNTSKRCHQAHVYCGQDKSYRQSLIGIFHLLLRQGENLFSNVCGKHSLCLFDC
jgi:hypothetical protein